MYLNIQNRYKIFKFSNSFCLQSFKRGYINWIYGENQALERYEVGKVVSILLYHIKPQRFNFLIAF